MVQRVILDPLYPEMEEATIGCWLVTPGQHVSEGQPVAELITDKVAYEYQCPLAGTILAVLVPEKSVVPVGTTLLVIGEPGEAVDDLEELTAENRRLAAAREASLREVHEVTTAQAAPPSAGGGGVRATPAARRLARERGIDLAALTGSGPNGMITADDIPEG
ncbi:MAG TPA: E3 binding domain-containing protein [Armatimonadota bacterium]|jgi:pyruvate dehydrogenase E2 component (dihydrolipoamide acetyltransferase)